MSYSNQNKLQVRTFSNKATLAQKKVRFEGFLCLYLCFFFGGKNHSWIDKVRPAPFSKLHSRTLAKVLSSGQTDLLEAMRCTRRTIIYKKESVARASNYKAYHVHTTRVRKFGRTLATSEVAGEGGAQLQH